jgi:Zn ribbon nucleic-acid-binding protein
MLLKKCEKCGFSPCKKNWKRNGLQRYKCVSCGHVRENKRHKIDYSKLYDEYTVWKQTYAQLGKRYGKSIPTIKKNIKSVTVNKKK